MGKKRIIKKGGGSVDQGLKARALARASKRKIDSGVLHIIATYNNTIVSLTDDKGGVVSTASSGSLGFKGAKKSTPFAAAKVSELVADKAIQMGVKTVSVVVNGVGAGRESAVRAFSGKGIDISKIQDRTPIPHNGPRPKKARRV